MPIAIDLRVGSSFLNSWILSISAFDFSIVVLGDNPDLCDRIQVSHGYIHYVSISRLSLFYAYLVNHQTWQGPKCSILDAGWRRRSMPSHITKPK
jgi:hypothetical protein